VGNLINCIKLLLNKRLIMADLVQSGYEEQSPEGMQTTDAAK
jgi:hypothetical protein